MWPEGWFNLALLYAEVNDYEYAIHSMQRYLELVPDAFDAAAARNKMIVCQDKLAKQ